MGLSGSRKYSLACRDIGIDDDFVSRGKMRADVVNVMLRYIMRVYGLRVGELQGYKVRVIVK